MTKIEQWQEWAKQYRDLSTKLDSTRIYFCVSGTDDEKNGRVKYDTIRDRIIISVYPYSDEVDLSVYAGKELLSVLKQLYEP